VSEDGSEGEYLLERVESTTAEGIKLPRNILLSKAC